MNGWPLRKREILRIVPRLQHSRQTIVNRLHHFVRFSSENCECGFPLTRLRMFPELPYPSHTEYLSTGNIELVLVTLLPIGQVLRFLDGARRNDAATLLEGVSPKLRLLYSFGTALNRSLSGSLNAQRISSICRSPFSFKWMTG